MNCGEVAFNRSTAALTNGVSGMRTPASDSRRVIAAMTELLIACLMRNPLSTDDWHSSDSDTPAGDTKRRKRLAGARPVRRIRSAELSAHSLRRRPHIAARLHRALARPCRRQAKSIGVAAPQRSCGDCSRAGGWQQSLDRADAVGEEQDDLGPPRVLFKHRQSLSQKTLRSC